MSEWQPIASAPKDGTPILAVRGAFVPAVAWFETIPDDLYLSGERSKWRTRYKDDFEDDMEYRSHFMGSDYSPTHWMPLPEPPEK